LPNRKFVYDYASRIRCTGRPPLIDVVGQNREIDGTIERMVQYRVAHKRAEIVENDPHLKRCEHGIPESMLPGSNFVWRERGHGG